LISAVVASSLTTLYWWLLTPHAAHADEAAETIVAHRVQIVDSDGTVRIVLQMGDLGPPGCRNRTKRGVSAALYTVDSPGGGAVLRLQRPCDSSEILPPVASS